MDNVENVLVSEVFERPPLEVLCQVPAQAAGKDFLA